MASLRRPAPRTGHLSRLVCAPILVALVASACSGGGDSARPRATKATTTAPTVLSARVSGGTVLENQVTTFDVDNGALQVLVPIGAVTKGTSLEVREVTGATTDLGAVQRAGRVYDLSFRNGTLRPNAKISLAFATNAALGGGSAPAAVDPAPVGGRWDDDGGSWQPAPSDATGTSVTVYATAAGRYTWMRWGWDRALQAGAAAIGSLVGPVAASANAVRCTDTDAARAGVDLAVKGSDALAWCIGRENGTDVLHVANTGSVPLALRTKGFGPARAVREDALAASVSAALAPSWSPPEGERVRVLAPHDELVLPFDAAATGARAVRLELNGIAQHDIAVLAAAAFATGFSTGHSALAGPILGTDAAVRAAVVEQLTAPACAGGLGATLNGDTFSVDRLATFAARLVRTCLDAKAIRLLQVAAVARPEGSLRSSFPSTAPTSVTDQFDAVMRTALSSLLSPTGGAPAGEIGVADRGRGAPDTPFTSAGAAPPATGPVVVPVTAAPPAVTSSEPGLVATTTTAAAAPSPTAAPATTTPATTRPATTAPPPATTQPPATTLPPATTQPPPPSSTVLSFTIAGGTCATNGGGTLGATSGQFTPGVPWTVTLRSPSNATLASSGTARGDGTIDWSFGCAGQQAGTWTAEASQSGHTSVTRSFVVNVYDTRDVAARVDLPLCSGAVTAEGNGSPAGMLTQTVVLGGRTTIRQIGIANREEFRGILRVLRNGSVLYSADVSGSGTNPVLVDNVGLTIDANPGDVVTLQLSVTQATAAHLNLTLNFWRTQADVAGRAEVGLDNRCPWNPRPAVASGTDLIGWILV